MGKIKLVYHTTLWGSHNKQGIRALACPSSTAYRGKPLGMTKSKYSYT